MTTFVCDIDKLVSSVLEGRGYGVLSSQLGVTAFFLLLTALTLTVIFAIAYAEDHRSASSKETTRMLACIGGSAYGLALVIGVASMVLGAASASYPTAEDAKMIITYKVGETVISNPKFQDIVERAIGTLPTE